MSRRLDLYPIDLEQLNSALSGTGLALLERVAPELLAEQREARPALLSQLLSGALRRAPLDVESGELASLITAIAYALRDQAVEASFDWGHLPRKLELLEQAGRLKGESQRLARAIREGRPLIGARIEEGWNSYAWVAPEEHEVFAALVREEVAPELEASPQELAWLQQVLDRRLGVFLAVG